MVKIQVFILNIEKRVRVKISIDIINNFNFLNIEFNLFNFYY